MGLTSEEKVSLSDIRFQKAQEMLSDAVLNMEGKRYKTAANRSYYAAYHAARSLLILKGIDPSTHDGVKAMFSLHFVKNNLISIETGKIYQNLMSLRNEADYDDFSEITGVEAENAINIVQKFIETLNKTRNGIKNEIIHGQ